MVGEQQRVSAATELYGALAKGDGATIDELLHPDFVGTTTAGLPLGLGGTYQGAQSMKDDFWWKLGASYLAQAHPEDFRALGEDRLFVHGRYRGEGRRSGLPLDAAFVHVLRFNGDLIVSLDQLTDSAAWAEALGTDAPLTTIEYSVRDGLAQVRLNRPDVRNAIDLQLAEETLVVARRLRADTTVRAVLISGNGPDLSVGGDIAYFIEHGGDDLGDLFRTMTTPFHEAFAILDQLEVPIVTAARGAVAGGGIGFVYAADIVLAAEDTKFVTAFGALGVSGDGGGSWHLPRRIGPARAARIMMENLPITATDAAAWGLISEVVPDEELDERALALATRLAVGPTRAFAQMRRLLHDSWGRDLPTQLRAETQALVETGRTADARRAVQAFTEKRRPTFEGR